ncbi:MAG: hypothetical protein AAGF20_13275 [Pseudomonadota bacterium]
MAKSGERWRVWRSLDRRSRPVGDLEPAAVLTLQVAGKLVQYGDDLEARLVWSGPPPEMPKPAAMPMLLKTLAKEQNVAQRRAPFLEAVFATVSDTPKQVKLAGAARQFLADLQAAGDQGAQAALFSLGTRIEGGGRRGDQRARHRDARVRLALVSGTLGAASYADLCLVLRDGAGWQTITRNWQCTPERALQRATSLLQRLADCFDRQARPSDLAQRLRV